MVQVDCSWEDYWQLPAADIVFLNCLIWTHASKATNQALLDQL